MKSFCRCFYWFGISTITRKFVATLLQNQERWPGTMEPPLLLMNISVSLVLSAAVPPGAVWWNLPCLKKTSWKWSTNRVLADRKYEMVDLVENRADSEVCKGGMKGCGEICSNPKWIKKLRSVVVDRWSDSG